MLTGLTQSLLITLSVALGLPANEGIDLLLAFDRLAWPLIFVAGLMLGYLYLTDRLPLHRLKEPQYRWVFSLSLLALLIFAILKQRFKIEAFDNIAITQAGFFRPQFGVLRVVNFAAQACVIVYLSVAGPVSKTVWIAMPGRVVNAVFTWRPLVLLGQYSLQVYAFHIVLVYLIYAAVQYFDIPPGPGTGDLLVFVGWGMMFALCAYLGWRTARPQPTRT